LAGGVISSRRRTRSGGLTIAAGDHALEKFTANEAPVQLLGEDWFDRLEAGMRQHIRSFIKAVLESERDHSKGIDTVTVIVRSSALSARSQCRCRARLVEADSTTREWCNQTCPLASG
jgi:hypothetical protein